MLGFGAVPACDSKASGVLLHSDLGAALTLLAWGAATALVSQVCWWGAVVIRFRDTRR
ncbi:hypothetical protein AB0L10_09510 [Streptomyces flaveolus]|uniref:hypothetical protein n=1 Tax=Streptomyces flaveolus TaxID=67297 RepID=UPI00342F9A12